MLIIIFRAGNWKVFLPYFFLCASFELGLEALIERERSDKHWLGVIKGQLCLSMCKLAQWKQLKGLIQNLPSLYIILTWLIHSNLFLRRSRGMWSVGIWFWSSGSWMHWKNWGYSTVNQQNVKERTESFNNSEFVLCFSCFAKCCFFFLWSSIYYFIVSSFCSGIISL